MTLCKPNTHSTVIFVNLLSDDFVNHFWIKLEVKSHYVLFQALKPVLILLYVWVQPLGYTKDLKQNMVWLSLPTGLRE